MASSKQRVGHWDSRIIQVSCVQLRYVTLVFSPDLNVYLFHFIVSTGLLVAIASQGAPISGSLWYLNYSAILVISLILLGVVISYLSVTSSHDYCETIFLTVYTPASQLFNVTVNLRDIYEDETARQQKVSQRDTPTWCKLLLFLSIVPCATDGITLASCAHVVGTTVLYGMLSGQMKTLKSEQEKNTAAGHFEYVYLTTILVLLIADMIIISGLPALCAFIYFLLVDITSVSAIKQRVENKNIEIMEGLEKYYTEGLIQLAEVSATIAMICVQPYVCLMYIPILYCNVYRPLVAFRLNVKKIHMESLCLANFEKATCEDIKSYDDVCAICLSGLNHARITPCKHIFHGKCLKDCLKKKAQCPMCNYAIL